MASRDSVSTGFLGSLPSDRKDLEALKDFEEKNKSKVGELTSQLEKDVEDPLMPFQLEELKRHSLKRAVFRQLPFDRDYLATPYLISFDKRISDEQREVILLASKEAVKKHREEIEKLMEKTKKKVVDVFPENLRRDVEAILETRGERPVIKAKEKR